MFLLSDASVFVLGDSVSGYNLNVLLLILCLSQSFVTIAPIHHLLEEAGGIHREGYVYGLSVHFPLAYRVVGVDPEPGYLPEGIMCAGRC